MKQIIIGFLLIIVLVQDILTIKISESLSYIDELLVLVVFAFLIIKIITRKVLYKSTITLLVLLLIFILVATFNTVLISDFSQYTILGIFLYIKGILFFIGIREMNFKVKDLIFVSRMLNVVGVTIVVFAIVDLFFYEQFRSIIGSISRVDIRYGIVSVQSLFVHPGTYGWFLMFLFLKNILEYKQSQNKKNLVLTIMFLLFSLLSLRFKVILSIIPIIIYALLKSKKSFVTTSLVVLSSLFLFSGLFIDLVSLTIDRYIDIDFNKSARKALYLFSFVIAIDYFPLGVGIGNYGSLYSKLDYSEVYYKYGLNNVWGLTPDNPMWVTDTFWPAILGETGALGLLIYLLIFIKIFFILIKNYKQESDSTIKKTFALMAIFVFIQAFIESAGEQIYLNSPQYLVLFGFIGMVISSRNSKH